MRELSVKDRVANIEKFLVFLVLFIALFDFITSGQLDVIIQLLPEKLEFFSLILILTIFLLTVSFLSYYFGIILLLGLENLSIEFEKLFGYIYDKTKPLLKYKKHIFVIISLPITYYLLELSLKEMLGIVILTIIGGILYTAFFKE